MPHNRRRLIVVVGPTAAGKSDLAVAIAGWFDGEIVSADAFQVYRGLDIGTAKIDASSRVVAHHCLDIADPGDLYTAARFAADAAAAIDGIEARQRQAVVAGGSGFYIRALIDGLAPLPEHDPQWSRAFEAIAARRGSGHLFRMLEAVDPQWASSIGAADRQRTMRGLEVTLRTGRPMSATLKQAGWSGPHYDAVWVGVTLPRPALYERIESRVDAMLAAGWLDEVRGLLERGVAADAPALRAIGYRQLVAHERGEMGLEQARDMIVGATRRYARRQLTWFRHQTPATWFEPAADEPAERRQTYEQVRAYLRNELMC